MAKEDKKAPEEEVTTEEEKKDPIVQIDQLLSIAGKVMKILNDNATIIKNNPKTALFVSIGVAAILAIMSFVS